MKTAIIGGGPAGLYLAYLLRREGAAHDVHLFERNPPSATFGFGVVFSDRALEFLRGDDEDSYQYLSPHMQVWPDLKIVHRDQAIAIDGNGFAAIGRLALLHLLHRRCNDVGVRLHFAHEVTALDRFDDQDLVVGADGLNSLVREARAAQFATATTLLANKFIWYGATKPFDCLTLTFRQNADGVFCAHHYRYAPNMSTFIVECDETTWQRARFAALDAEATRAYCQRLFAADLDGHALLSNKSIWRNFPAIWNECWSAGRVVLLGDALRTAHFSIGSGTRLAMEDALALAAALKAEPRDLAAALARFEAARRPVVETIVAASNLSARWYERMAEAMRLAPQDFAYSYMTRTGRISDQRLEKLAPRFFARYQAARRERLADQR